MAYLVTNNRPHKVILSNGIIINEGETLSISEIGTTEICLQDRGVITISRVVSDNDKDDARFVEIISDDFLKNGIYITRPSGFQILNPIIENKDTWYLIAGGINNLMAWKLKMRPSSNRYYSFHYKFDASETYMSADPGERIFADVAFDELYVRVPNVDNQIMELELWLK